MKNGFTLVELVVTILIISILGTFAFVRFSGNSGFAEVTFQERLVSALRNTQQRAMQDTRQATVYQLNFQQFPPAFAPPQAPNGSSALFFNTDEDFLSTNDLNEISSENVTMSLNDQGSAFNFVRFDGLGRPTTSAGQCLGGCEIDFIGEQTARVCIEPEGYIHAGNCDA